MISQILSFLVISKKFCCCGNNRTAIGRRVEAMCTNITQGINRLATLGLTVFSPCVTYTKFLSVLFSGSCLCLVVIVVDIGSGQFRKFFVLELNTPVKLFCPHLGATTGSEEKFK